jgi:hypothetical protein
MTLSLMDLFLTLSIYNTQPDDTQHCSIECTYDEYPYAEC